MSAQLAQALQLDVEHWKKLGDQAERDGDWSVADVYRVCADQLREALAAFEAAPQQAQAPKVAVCDFVQVDDSSKSSRSQHDADSAELRSLCAERDELRRWKSTYAPRLAALEGSLQHAQREAAQGMEARSALASEREANAILTDELEAQQAQAPIDPDGAESRAGFRAFDEAQMARWATPWQVWREAVKWAAPQQGSKT